MDTLTLARYALITIREMETHMVTGLYEPPVLIELGSVRALTQARPPGKDGPIHDGSQFQSNFSCVTSPRNCAGGANP